MSMDKTHIIPVVASEIFQGSDAQFAIRAVSGSEPSAKYLRDEFAGAAILRANTYLDSHYIDEDDLNEDGTELDANDARSTHLIVFERAATASMARVVGNMRLVTKGSGDTDGDLLPIERYFPDAFSPDMTPAGTVEVSRLIARHEDPRVQNAIKWPLFVAGYQHVTANGLGPVYGLLAPTLARQLAMQKVPVQPLADARYIDEIRAKKQPTVIDLDALGKLVAYAGDLGIKIDESVSHFDIRVKERTDA